MNQHDRKAVLYIDVEDTLMGTYNGHNQLRPDVVKHLRELGERFDARFLTTWPWERLRNLFAALYAEDITNKIGYEQWNVAEGKATHIIKGPTDFWWLEDQISEAEMTRLRNANRADRFVAVSPKGPDGFTTAVQELYRRLREPPKLRPDKRAKKAAAS